jgi:hypothetical protein
MISLFSCQKEEEQVATSDSVSEETLGKIHKLGFSTQNVQRIDEGYLVEGDIVLTEADLNTTPEITLLRAGSEEQYRTTNLVTRLPRVITISMNDSKIPASYGDALAEAIRRYNAEGLTITLTRVASGGNINIVNANGSYLASAGFPTSSGDPYGQVKINVRSIGTQPVNTVATIIAHELGHCIGFRHTDYMDRSYSCGGSTANEGASTVGAILIPGTPSEADPNSWMLACIGSRQDRPFNANDKTALKYLYSSTGTKK